jgi:hypothetical protein
MTMTVPLLHVYTMYIHVNMPLTCSCALFSPPKADLEATLREVYAIPADTPCRVWHRYMSHTYKLLSDPSQTLQDAGLYNMQVL